MTNPAPSEEFVLHCDVAGCPAQLSMVAGVARSEHGWGRVSAYGDDNSAQDYDLCTEHHAAMNAVLEGRLRRFGDDLWWEAKP